MSGSVCSSIDAKWVRVKGDCPNCGKHDFVSREFARAWRKEATKKAVQRWKSAEESDRIVKWVEE